MNSGISESNNKVLVGLSGGVDSSVAAALLKRAGYEVIGLFMNNWHETSDDGCCTAENDYADVRRVCAELDIPYYTADLSREYNDRVFKLFLDEYKKGRTPNPDVLCNREIKFGPFADYAAKLGCKYVATGHYCGTLKEGGYTHLLRAKDENKCQSYFLNQLSMKQLENVIFPLADLMKSEVRKIAEENNLITASKKDSTGICFIGEKNFRQFLSSYIPMKKGDIKTLDGKTIGTHNGVFFYTTGQRKGLGLGGIKGEDNLEPWFIVKRDIEKNIIYVSQGEDGCLFSSGLETGHFNFISRIPEKVFRAEARLRHRQKLFSVTASLLGDGSVRVEFDEKQRAAAEGQYCVLYQDRICLGGGAIEKTFV